MLIETRRPSFLRVFGVVTLSLFLCTPTIAQVPSTSTQWNKCEIDCINQGGGENLVKACVAACAKAETSVMDGTMVPRAALNASPTPAPKPLTTTGKNVARPDGGKRN